MILDLAVSVEHRLVTDGQTDRHTTTANTRASYRRAGKNWSVFAEVYIFWVLSRSCFRLSFQYIFDAAIVIMRHCSVSDDVEANSGDTRSGRRVDTRHTRLIHPYIPRAVYIDDNCAVTERVDTSRRWLHTVPTPIVRRSFIVHRPILQLDTDVVPVRQ